MTAVYILLYTLIIIFILALLYYIYRQVMWSKVNNKYAFSKFREAINEIDKLHKFATPLMRRKMLIYKTSSAFLVGDDDLFLECINKINKNSLTYGQYYYYYMIAYYIKKEDYQAAENFYGILTKKFKISRELDLVTPLAILMAQKGDEKAFKKLRELKRSKHIDTTFVSVANDYIKKNKRKGASE